MIGGFGCSSDGGKESKSPVLIASYLIVLIIHFPRDLSIYNLGFIFPPMSGSMKVVNRCGAKWRTRLITFIDFLNRLCFEVYQWQTRNGGVVSSDVFGLISI
jgi:hypothetical protein